MRTSTRCNRDVPRGRTRWANSIRLFLMLFLSGFLALTINAQTPVIDGKPNDWPGVLSGSLTIKALIPDPQNSSTDDIWTGGSSDVSPISSWAWTNNSANDKNDLKNTGFALANNVLYFFGDRFGNNGDAQLGIWLLKGTVSKNPDGSFSGAHQNGDILLRSHFVNGGTVADRAVYVWQGGPNGGPVLTALPLTALNFKSNTGVEPVPSPFVYSPKSGSAQTYPENSFVEGFLDLTALAEATGTTLDLCFASFLIETGNSQSINSSLEDFVLGRFGSIPAAQTLNGSSFCSGGTGTITMTSSENGVNYQLKEGNTNVQSVKAGTGSQIQWTGLAAGTYHVVATNTVTNCTNDFGPVDVTADPSPSPTAHGLTVCENGSTGQGTFNLNSAIDDADGGAVSFYTSLADAQSASNAIATPGSYASATGATIYVRSANGSCYGTTSFTLTVTDNPDVVVQNLPVCETGGTGSTTVNLNNAIVDADGGTVSFFTSLANAQANTSSITSPGSYSVSVGTTPIWVRAANGTCVTITLFDVAVTSNATASAGTATPQCRNASGTNTFGTNTFNLSGSGSGGNPSWSVIENLQGYTVNITNGTTFTPTVALSGAAVNGGSVTLQLTVSGGTCGMATSNVVLTLIALPIIYNVVGTDFCPSAPNTGTITLSGSEIGVNYQLRKDGTPEGDAKEGTGSPLVWNNLGSGTYDVLATRIGTSCSTTTGSDDVAQNNAPDPSVKNLTSCEDGSTGGASFDLNNAVTGADGGTITFYTNSADAQAGTNSISASQTVTVAASPKTFWVRSENTTTGCYGFSSFTVTVTDNPDVTTQPLTNCESGTSGTATFNLSNGVVSADGGMLTFYTSQADANGATNAIADAANYVAHNGDVIYVRSTNGACFGTSSFTITVTDNPDVTEQNIAAQCNNPSASTATVDLNSGVVSPDGGTVTFHLSQVDANTGANAILDPSNYIAHDGDVIYVRSANGSCFGTTSFTITVAPCQTTLNCSYTMGFYGNPGGKACDGNVPQTTLTLINQLIGGGFTLGRADLHRSLYVPAGAGQKIIDYLPLGGPAAILSGDCNITANPSCMPSKNVLLGQTITLKLNMGLNGGSLAGFDLAGHGGQYLVTQKRSGCGENATVVSCTNNPGAIQSFWINAKVVSYLEANYGGALVSDLMDLANDALGGALPKASATVPSLSEINSVIDAINRGFDECRSFVKFSACEVTCVNASYPDPCNPPIVSSRTVRELSSQMASADNKLMVSAYPNPYTDVVKFTIQSNVSGKAQLEVVNMLGQRIATIYNGYVQANKGQIVEYKVPTAAQQTLIYVLTVGDKKVTGKVLKANK